ncbi:MAG: UTP--glucose-1-phosphate uridylyltransferase [Caldilineaceae bacterium]|nr:UTP--glucose-1-phosphate uridylyltransferase [Caldilineaceae bacterium]
MAAAGLPDVVIDNFRHYYRQLAEGATGFITRDEAQPVTGVPEYDHLTQEDRRLGAQALDHTVILKLNGGLGTSMGMQGPKSLLTVKNGLSFLDILIHQVMYLRETAAARVPLVLMDSFTTHAATLAVFDHYVEFEQDVPVDFLQHKVPKVWKKSLAPVTWPDDPDKEWCPPGHGDIYPALLTSGMLDALLDAGYEYAFVSNADNLGATLDLAILGHFARYNLPFLMEVAHRTAADRKGGHLAQRPDGQLILRESAQCPPEEAEEFQDIRRFGFFNTNNLWLNLKALAAQLKERHGILGLPLIRNEKPVDPSAPSSPRVYQLETAMGAAIAVFPGAEALCVPRSRFVPVKKNSDLLVLKSDAYILGADYTLTLAEERQGRPPVVLLDDRYYQLIDAMQERFPHGAPSLRHCDELRVQGDVRFGRNVVVEGCVQIVHAGDEPLQLQDGATLRNGLG